MTILQPGDDRMNIDSLFQIPQRGSRTHTMLVCNEGFKKTKSAGKLLIQFQSVGTEVLRAPMNCNGEQGAYTRCDSCRRRSGAAPLHSRLWNDSVASPEALIRSLREPSSCLQPSNASVFSHGPPRSSPVSSLERDAQVWTSNQLSQEGPLEPWRAVTDSPAVRRNGLSRFTWKVAQEVLKLPQKTQSRGLYSAVARR